MLKAPQLERQRRFAFSLVDLMNYAPEIVAVWTSDSPEFTCLTLFLVFH